MTLRVRKHHLPTLSHEGGTVGDILRKVTRGRRLSDSLQRKLPLGGKRVICTERKVIAHLMGCMGPRFPRDMVAQGSVDFP